MISQFAQRTTSLSDSIEQTLSVSNAKQFEQEARHGIPPYIGGWLLEVLVVVQLDVCCEIDMYICEDYVRISGQVVQKSIYKAEMLL